MYAGTEFKFCKSPTKIKERLGEIWLVVGLIDNFIYFITFVHEVAVGQVVVVVFNGKGVGFIVELCDREYTGIEGLLVMICEDNDRNWLVDICDIFDSNARHSCNPLVPNPADILFVTTQIPNSDLKYSPGIEAKANEPMLAGWSVAAAVTFPILSTLPVNTA